MKIYTGVGDRGRTSLFSGERVPKSDARIEAYGDVDELNSYLGALSASLNGTWEDLVSDLARIQSDLFHLGAYLATTPGSPALDSLTQLGGEDIARLEQAIDRMQAELPELMGFVLPGGHASAAWAHVGRAVCRRAERRVVAFHAAGDDAEPKPEGSPLLEASPMAYVLIYLNRLSDYLFVIARTCNQRAGVGDQHWEG